MKKIEKLFGVLEKIHKTWICVKNTTKQIYIVRIRSLEENNNLQINYRKINLKD